MESVESRLRRCERCRPEAWARMPRPGSPGFTRTPPYASLWSARSALRSMPPKGRHRSALRSRCTAPYSPLDCTAPLRSCPGATAPYGSPSAGCPALAPCPPRARSMARMTSPSPRAPDCAHDQPPFCRLMQDVRMYSQTGLRPVCEYIRSWQGCALHPPPGLPRAFRHVASGAARAGLPRRFATWLPALRLATHALVG